MMEAAQHCFLTDLGAMWQNVSAPFPRKEWIIAVRNVRSKRRMRTGLYSAKTSSVQKNRHGQPLAGASQIAVCEDPPEIVLFKPVIKVDLVQERGYNFLGHFMRFGAQERHAHSRQHRD